MAAPCVTCKYELFSLFLDRFGCLNEALFQTGVTNVASVANRRLTKTWNKVKILDVQMAAFW